jgi:hypothetical protein
LGAKWVALMAMKKFDADSRANPSTVVPHVANRDHLPFHFHAPIYENAVVARDVLMLNNHNKHIKWSAR